MVRVRAQWPLAGILSGVVILASGAVPSEAQVGRAPLVRLEQELGLSEDQSRAIRDIHERQRQSRRQLVKTLIDARRALRELILKGADDGAIQAKSAEVRDLVAEALELRVRALQEIARILTPEQREKLLDLGARGRHGGLPLAG